MDPYGNGRLAFILATTGMLWSLALVPAAFLFPAYGGEASTSTGATVHTTDTLVGVNGPWAVALFVPPVLLAAVAWLGLHRSCSSGSRFGRLLGQGAAWLLLAFAVFSFSAGFLVLPAALLLVVAALRTPASA
jgi:hypothetical protein